MEDSSMRDIQEDDDLDEDGVSFVGPAKIKCAGQSEQWTKALIAFIWTAVSIYSIQNFVQGPLDWPRDGLFYAAIAAIFPGLSVLLLIGALVAARRYGKYGESFFELAQGSAYLGEIMKGVIRPSKVLVPTGPCELTLECTETKTVRSSGGKTRQTTRRLWKEEKSVPASNYQASRTIKVEWNIPATCMACGDSRAEGSISWILTLKVPTKGVDFKAEFSVPVLDRSQRGQDDLEE